MKRLLRGLALLPVVTTLLFYAYILGWRVYLGRWPQYGSPDAGTLYGFVLLPDIALFILLAASVFSILPILSLVFACIVGRRHAVLWPGGVLAITSWVLFMTLFRFDPGAFLEWYLD